MSELEELREQNNLSAKAYAVLATEHSRITTERDTLVKLFEEMRDHLEAAGNRHTNFVLDIVTMRNMVQRVDKVLSEVRG